MTPPTHATADRTISATVLWRWIALVLALTQLAAPAVAHALAGDFLASGATNEAAITPAGYAFGIWAVICVACAVTTVGIVVFGLGAVWETAALVNVSIVFVGFSMWLFLAAHHWLWMSVVVFAVMVAALFHTVWLLVRRRQDMRCPRWLGATATLTFGLYLGWSSVAVFVNIAAALVQSGASPSQTLWQAVILSTGSVFALILTFVLRATPGYLAGSLWALIGVTVGTLDRHFPALTAVSACAASLLALAAIPTAVRERRR